MFKNICLIAAGILLSGVLFSIGVWSVLKLTPAEPILAAMEPGSQAPQYPTYEESEAPFEILRRTTTVIDFALLPSVALLVGCFVGFFAIKQTWQLAVLSFLPLLGLYLAGHSWRIDSVGVGLACSAIAASSAYWMSRRRAATR